MKKFVVNFFEGTFTLLASVFALMALITISLYTGFVIGEFIEFPYPKEFIQNFIGVSLFWKILTGSISGGLFCVFLVEKIKGSSKRKLGFLFWVFTGLFLMALMETPMLTA
ncbi:hypothetical protein COB87_000345 [Candidatus Wolfebacteria bacterium]|nr:hypothetical protein [Candidatus Wolfebacteria bacterium]